MVTMTKMEDKSRKFPQFGAAVGSRRLAPGHGPSRRAPVGAFRQTHFSFRELAEARRTALTR